MPRRSSGCDLCRKRKVRCDEQRPRCQRCTNFGAECPGYARTESVIFRHQTTTTASKAKPRRIIQPQSQDLPWDYHSGSSASDLSDVSITPAHRPSPSPFDINSTSETRTLLLAGLLDTYMPRPESRDSDIENQYSYLHEIPHCDSANIAFTTAVDALSVVHLGTHHSDQNLLHQSRLLYGKALSYLYRALLHPKLQTQDETLAAVAILGLCDFFRGTSQNGTGWLSHAAGAKGLLKHRGPKSIKSPLSLKLFLSQRNTSLLGGFFARKAVFFDQPDWLGVTAELSDSNDWVAISDIMVHVPALLEETDAKCASMSHDNPSQEASLEIFSLLERYNKLQKQLEDWYSNLTSRREGEICQSVDVMKLTEFWRLCPDLAFPTVLYFPSFYLAFLYALYSFASFILCKNAADVRTRLSSRHTISAKPQHRSLPSLIILRHLAHHHITQLARSVPYLCTAPSASVGRIQCLAFLFFVQDYFGAIGGKSPLQTLSDLPSSEMPKVHSPQYLWCWKIYTALATTGIVPPRANIHAKSKEGGPVVEKVPSFGEDDVGDSIGKVVEKLGVGVRSVDISEDGKTSSNGAKTTNHGPSSGDTSPSSYTSASELSQEMRPSKEFLKTEEDFMRNKWLSEDFEATRMAAGD